MPTPTTPVPATPAPDYPRFALDQLVPSPLNPRKRFDEASLGELARSIQSKGEVIVPLLLRPRPKSTQFEIIDGERRWRAARSLNGSGPTTVPGLVRADLTDADVLEIQLLSAIQRQDLTPLEEAAGYRALIASNPSHYSAAYIADKIGRSEKYVYDRMKLLDAIPAVQALLEAERILVGHAEILAKLKPEDQERALDPDSRDDGLWREAGRTLFEDDEDDQPGDEFLGLVPRTVAELQAWVARHVRFDVEHMATAAPLDFGPVADQVTQAKDRPGRGKKVIAITHEHFVQPDAKDAAERTFGPSSWRRADDTPDHHACESSVLGVVAVGPGYGEAFQVCIARDRCEVHWQREIAEKRKTQQLRASGKGGEAAKRESAARQREEQQRAKAEAERQAWLAQRPEAAKAVAAFLRTAPIKALAAALDVSTAVQEHFPKISTADDLVRALVLSDVLYNDWSPEQMAKNTKAFGFDLKKWRADQAQAAKPKTGAKSAKPKAAKAKKPAAATGKKKR